MWAAVLKGRMIDLGSIAEGTGKAAEAEAAMAGSEPAERIGRPEEVAAPVVWLCPDSASFVTSIAMPDDGGLVAT